MPFSSALLVTEEAGVLTYSLDCLPGELPAVRGRDLAAAWDWARDAACRADWSTARVFRFRRADGSWGALTLTDQDARSWAGAIDRAIGLRSFYGLSICLRLLALVDLLGRAPWARSLVSLDPSGTDLPPALLRLAAAARLTDDARFDEGRLRHTLPPGAALCAGE